MERTPASRNSRLGRLELRIEPKPLPSSGSELPLKLILATLFLPEGLSFFIGDFRLTVARVLLILFSTTAIIRCIQAPERVFIASDFFALAAAFWMVVANTWTEGFNGFKGAAIVAIEFSSCYYIFRFCLGSANSCVRIVSFASKLLVVVIAIALLDPLTGKLFSYEFAKSITGYTKLALEQALAEHAEAVYRDGLLRATGPLEHSILFGCVCVWLSTLAYCTFPYRIFSWGVATFAAVGLWFSQARGAWLAFVIALALSGYAVLTKGFPMRWKLVGAAVAALIVAVFSLSGAPIATLMRLGGISPEAAYYRQAIWETAGPLVIHSPLFGIGTSWDWQANSDLYGPSVDAFWLQNSMTYGIPSTLFVFLTMISPFWRGPLWASPYLTTGERRLSIALGIVTVTAIFLGFIVHFWGTCWTLLGLFPALRANLVEASVLRSKDPQWEHGSVKRGQYSAETTQTVGNTRVMR